jgi:hypothetical protein
MIMFNNLKPIEWFLWMISLLIAFFLGAGLKALWELLKDAAITIAKKIFE